MYLKRRQGLLDNKSTMMTLSLGYHVLEALFNIEMSATVIDSDRRSDSVSQEKHKEYLHTSLEEQRVFDRHE